MLLLKIQKIHPNFLPSNSVSSDCLREQNKEKFLSKEPLRNFEDEGWRVGLNRHSSTIHNH